MSAISTQHELDRRALAMKTAQRIVMDSTFPFDHDWPTTLIREIEKALKEWEERT